MRKILFKKVGDSLWSEGTVTKYNFADNNLKCKIKTNSNETAQDVDFSNKNIEWKYSM